MIEESTIESLVSAINSNLHRIDDDVDGRVCDNENVADIGDDALRHPESLVVGELRQAWDQLL